MVEVIKHGEKNIIDCNFCGAQLRYSVDDIKEQEKYLSQRDSYFEKYIVCPDCKNKVVIKWGNDMNEIVLTIILTLIVHSLIGTVIYIATNENDD